jgi:hypothetical protein
MSFTEPMALTIDAVPSTLPRVSTGVNKSDYISADGLIRISAAHTYGRRTRRVLRLDHSKVTSDPFIPSQNVKVSMSNYLVFDLPPAGYTNDNALKAYQGFKTLFTSGSDALIIKLLGGES